MPNDPLRDLTRTLANNPKLRPYLPWLFGLALIALLFWIAVSSREKSGGGSERPAESPGTSEAPPEAVADGQPRTVFFCFWNVENLFDDRADKQVHVADKAYDAWFAEDAAARELKYNNLSKALVQMNDGRGPDILAVAEVEGPRAVELLRDALNKRLANPALHYKNLLIRDPHGGRHIATAILTRLPVDERKTSLLGRRMRILEGHVKVNGHDLALLATHWTSRVSDREGEGRDKYAEIVYNRYQQMARGNPRTDVLICGDFNDPPDEASVTKHLHATGDRAAVLRAPGEMLFNLMADKDPQQFGTHYYSRWYIFDQIVVSAGMLDELGWSCEPDSVRTVNALAQPADKLRRPWPFGSERERRPRGYSDHFPVTVQLRVAGGRVGASSEEE